MNLKEAFSASDSEKIMRVVDYSDIVNRKQIDPLSIMTYLYQIRDHFENPFVDSTSGQTEKERANVENAIKKLSMQTDSNPFEESDEIENESRLEVTVQHVRSDKVDESDSSNPFNETG